jgi:hypothetical protein
MAARPGQGRSGTGQGNNLNDNSDVEEYFRDERSSNNYDRDSQRRPQDNIVTGRSNNGRSSGLRGDDRR